ncbi:HAD family hydrolase [Streptomyces sp. NPDC051320]|uniref:HAD family hydrolase n=1 Tax=Streptomyces sp. NPDC051320 TaxID=3154644 RepID=UPI0034267F8A
MIDTVAFDIGETLIHDDRYWASWADWLGVARHTVAALVGAVTAQGRDNADALRLLRPGIDIAHEYVARDAAGLGEQLADQDLYDDVRPELSALRGLGVRVVVAGNQTVKAAQLLRALDLPADVVATSGEWGVAKPSPDFFARVIEAAQTVPQRILYVGDHPVNDVFPAKRAGLKVAHLRRGPWGHLWADDPVVQAAADWRIRSLAELRGLVRE